MNNNRIYRLEFKGRHSKVWHYFMQFHDRQSAVRTKKSVQLAHPDMTLRLRTFPKSGGV